MWVFWYTPFTHDCFPDLVDTTYYCIARLTCPLTPPPNTRNVCLQWLLSFPIEAKTYALQQQVAQQVSTAQWAADRRVWWAKPPQNQYLNPGNSAQQAQLLQKLAELKDKHSSSRGSGAGSGSGSDSEDDSDDVRMTDGGYGAGGDVSPDDIVVVEELGAVEEDESSSDDSSDGGPAAAAAAGSGSQLAGYPCPLPLTYLLTLPKEVGTEPLLIPQLCLILSNDALAIVQSQLLQDMASMVFWVDSNSNTSGCCASD